MRIKTTLGDDRRFYTQLVKHKYSEVPNKQVQLLLFWEKIAQIFTLEKVKLALKLYFWNVFDGRNTFKPLGTPLPTSLKFFFGLKLPGYFGPLLLFCTREYS